jgi:hypothetical protein
MSAIPRDWFSFITVALFSFEKNKKPVKGFFGGFEPVSKSLGLFEVSSVSDKFFIYLAGLGDLDAGFF